jgi:hypothetical protein
MSAPYFIYVNGTGRPKRPQADIESARREAARLHDLHMGHCTVLILETLETIPGDPALDPPLPWVRRAHPMKQPNPKKPKQPAAAPARRAVEVQIKQRRAGTPGHDGLVGMFLHMLKDGEINFQGHILAVDGNIAMVQLFSFMTGYPTQVVAIKKSRIYSDECRLYATCALMNFAFEKENQKSLSKTGQGSPAW